jgi:hypothetical protein
MTYPRLRDADFSRFATKVTEKRSGNWMCWEWTGKRDRFGYPRFWLDGSWRQAHRVAWVWLVAEAPEPVLRVRRRSIPDHRPQLDHLCNNESCIRPTHLRPVTQTENQRLRVARNPKYRTKRSLQGKAA